jgi:riboflavin synthase
VEIDVVAKYVEKGIEAYFAGTAGGNMSILEKMVGRIVDEKLKQ